MRSQQCHYKGPFCSSSCCATRCQGSSWLSLELLGTAAFDWKSNGGWWYDSNRDNVGVLHTAQSCKLVVELSGKLATRSGLGLGRQELWCPLKSCLTLSPGKADQSLFSNICIAVSLKVVLNCVWEFGFLPIDLCKQKLICCKWKTVWLHKKSTTLGLFVN